MKDFEKACTDLHKESDQTFIQIVELQAARNPAHITHDEFMRHRDIALEYGRRPA